MVNKQSTSTQSTQHTEEVNPLVGEKMDASFLLRGWNMALEVVNEAVQHNIKSQVKYPERFTSAWFDHQEPMGILKAKNWIRACINSKSNTPYTLDILENTNVISSEERPLFGELPLPRREINSLHRIQMPNKMEYLSRTEHWFGLNKSAGIVTMAVEPDYTKRIEVRREYVPKNPENPGGEQVLVKIVGDSNQWNMAEKIWLTPFSKSVVEQAFRNAIPTTDKTLRGVSLILIREGSPQIVQPVQEDNNLDSFVNKSFDEMYEKALRPVTNTTNVFNIDPEQMKAFLRYQQEHSKDPQYQ